MENIYGLNKNDEPMELPPGFRFHPTDEELITHYLSLKVVDSSFSTKAIGEVDLNQVEPWDLPRKAKMGEKEWYFFCLRDRKYPTGLRTNRATEAGYWKATGKDKEIFRAKFLVGMKKTLVFYRGRAPRGEKTNWVMHEYRLDGKHSMHNLPKSAKSEWVICRIYNKTSGGKEVHISGLITGRHSGTDSQQSDLLPPLMDLSSDENQLGIAADVSHDTCLAEPVDNPGHKLFHEFTSRNCDFSPLPFTSPQTSAPNLVFQPQIIPRTQSLNNQDCLLIQDQSILRLLLENNAPNTTPDAKGVFYHEVEFKPYEDNEFPIISTASTDLDCLWDY